MNVYTLNETAPYRVIVRDPITNKSRSITIHSDGGLEQAADWAFNQITGGNTQQTPCESNEKNTTELPREASSRKPDAPTPGELSDRIDESIRVRARRRYANTDTSKQQAKSFDAVA